MGKRRKNVLGEFNVFSLILLLSLVLLFAGCGGGGGGGSSSSSGSATTKYQLFQSSSFVSGTQEIYDLTGSGTGGSYTGSLTLTTQPATTFNGVAAIPVDGVITFTSTVSSQRSYTYKGIEYFNTDTSALEYLGFENDTFNDTTVSSKSVEVLPETASIGASATEGIYTFSSGNIETVTWQLTQASGGNANLNIVQTITDSTGKDTLYTQNYTFLIDQDGNRQSVILELSEGGVSVTLSGNKI